MSTAPLTRIGTLPQNTRLPGLDGLRALAVLAVMVFHAGYFAAGWIGVQVFFVLSGFLITRILLRAKETCQNDEADGGQLKQYLLRFYVRRTRRIVPLYLLYFCALWLSWMLWKEPAFFSHVKIALLTYTINFARVFPTFPESSAYSHLWSLAVEEQFYLVWPFLVWFVVRRRLSIIVTIMIGLAPISRWLMFALFSWAFPNNGILDTGHAVYNLPTSHMDAFGWGAALALGWPILWQKTSRRFLAATFFVTFLGTGMLVYFHGSKSAGLTSLGFPLGLADCGEYIWGYSVLNIWSALLIAWIVTARPSHPTLRALTHPWVSYVGIISYGIYVWHGLILTLATRLLHLPLYRPIGVQGSVIMIVGSIGISALSFHFFESRFLRLQNLLNFSNFRSELSAREIVINVSERKPSAPIPNHSIGLEAKS